MKRQRYTTHRLVNLILAALILPCGFVPSGYSRSRHLVSSLAPPLTRSAQGGRESWKPVNTGLGSLDIAALAIDPVNTATIYVGTRGGGMFKSIDGGATWSKVGLGYSNVAALAINFVNPNIVYAGVDDGGWCSGTFPIFKSTDSGATWSNANSPADCGISMLVMDPTSPNTLYAGSLGQYLGSGSIQLWKTTDGGATWRVVFFGNPGLSPIGLAVNPANPQTLYAPGDFYTNMNVIDSGLFKSTDGGSNWSATGLEQSHGYTYIRAVAIDPLNPSTLYAGSTNNGMLKSTDGSAKWSAINKGLPNISTITAIVIDRDNPSILYIGASGGVFKSTDGGENWSAFNNGLTNLYIQVLSLAPGNPNTLYAGTASGVFKIADNTPATNPIDDAQFFVRQHYLDFLNREPNQDGFDYWTNEINKCGPDLLCINRRRVGVSGAFFVEQEFNRTGGFIYRTFKTALGRPPSYSEFTQDRPMIIEGETLASTKAAYTAAFVRRPEFLQLCPAGLSAEQFIDDLLNRVRQVSNVDLSSQRGALISMSNNGAGRATALRTVADDAAVLQAEKNSSFVRMQYFGYLRRDPDAGGEAFWLDVVTNREVNNYLGMVCAFITSREYQERFSTAVTRSNADCANVSP